MKEPSGESEDFQLKLTRKAVVFPKIENPTEKYSNQKEKAIGKWAYEKATAEGPVFSLIQNIGNRILDIYEAYIKMQQQLGIPAITDLELARAFKTVGMSHEGVLKLQTLANTDEFARFSSNVESIIEDTQTMASATTREMIWQEVDRMLKGLVEFRSLPQTNPDVMAFFGRHPSFQEAMHSFFSIPLELRNMEEMKKVNTLEKLDVLMAHQRHTEKRRRHPFPSHPAFDTKQIERANSDSKKSPRFYNEIWQRNGNFKVEEYLNDSVKNPHIMYKAGAIPEILSVLSHVDSKKRSKAAASRKISNDAVYRAVMTFMTQQHVFLNEIYRMPPENFKRLNAILVQEKGFQLKPDSDSTIKDNIKDGGGAYALFSNRNIREKKSSTEKKEAYDRLSATSNDLLERALLNPSRTEALGMAPKENPNKTMHLFRGGDIFSVPKNRDNVVSKDSRARDYMANVENLNYPVVAGISGTTSRNFTAVYAMGLLNNQSDLGNLLIANIGFMVPIGHHSVFEITSTLKSFNIPFDHAKGIVEGIGDFIKDPSFSAVIEDSTRNKSKKPGRRKMRNKTRNIRKAKR